MQSPWRIVAVSLALLASSAVSGSLVRSSPRALRAELQFLVSTKSAGAGTYDPFASEHFYGNLKCGETVQIGAKDHKFEECPEECPYYAQDLEDDLHCSFVCVPATECATRNPRRPIADVIDGHKTCRGPRVSDCKEYVFDGTDSCKRCQLFYSVASDGLCYFDHALFAWICVAIILVIALGVLVWVIDCCIRPSVNQEGLMKGEQFRSLQKIRDENNQLYNIKTNLCVTDVAGPGMLLHFNMQVFIIIWAFVIAVIWFCMATFIDDALFILGTRRFGTPRENCILVAWGYETQQRLMWTKVMFLIIAYIFTFCFTLAHAIRQQAIFERLNAKEATMKNFMVYLSGLPVIKGEDANAEGEIKEFLTASGVDGVVGVSICWNYEACADDVVNFLEKDMLVRDKKHQGRNWQEAEKTDYSDEISNPIRKRMYKMEKSLLDDPEEDPEDWSKDKQIDLIKSVNSSENAFVVFKTQNLRNAAIEKGEISGFRGCTIKFHDMLCEPDTVYWQNFGHNSTYQRVVKVLQGFGAILLALFFWCTVFYTPYSYQVFCFNYENGAQPPAWLAFAFGMVVVVGNAIMCEVCGQVSDHIGFKTRDARESCYLILYVIACMFNVILDMVTTYFLAESILDGLGFRSYHGVRFMNVPDFTERFETYAMQRMLAENTKAYAFPATFLIPFLIEPFVTVIMPFLVGKTMVSTHKEWVGRDAERWMVAFEFDMGRYGDLLLDMVLAIMIFFFPGGYTLILFFGLAGSHCYIYLFDHSRVLCTIPKCTYASMDVDWWGCWMMAPITAMIPMCLVFKANCQDYGYCIEGLTLIEVMWATFILHTLIHTLLLLHVVPLLKPRDFETPATEYVAVARQFPCNWFTSNPIHCLRSQHLHGLSATEYCSFYVLGKSHILNYSPKIGLHYQGTEGEGEDFEDFSKTLSKGFSQKLPDK